MIYFILGLLISDGEQSTASQVCEITVLNDNKVIDQFQDFFVFDAFFFLRLTMGGITSAIESLKIVC